MQMEGARKKLNMQLQRNKEGTYSSCAAYSCASSLGMLHTGTTNITSSWESIKLEERERGGGQGKRKNQPVKDIK